MVVRSFKELDVWVRSVELATDVYELCKQLPADEKFGIVSQMTRATVSIPSNIAEGQQRNNRAEFRHFIGIAKGSAAELETQLIIIGNVYKINSKEQLEKLEIVQKMLTSLSKKLDT